jgi:hypothetical protein
VDSNSITIFTKAATSNTQSETPAAIACDVRSVDSPRHLPADSRVVGSPAHHRVMRCHAIHRRGDNAAPVNHQESLLP